VKGLTQNSTGSKTFHLPKDNSTSSSSRPTPPERTQEAMRPPKRPRPLAPSPAQAVQDRQQEASRQQREDVEIQEVVPVKSEPLAQHSEVSYMEDQVEAGNGAMVEAETYSEEYGDYGDEYETGQGYGASAAENKEVDDMVTQMMTKLENQDTGLPEFSCTVCQKVMKQKRHMINHVETHIQGMSHLCNLCGKSFKTRNSRDKHKYTYHKERTGTIDSLPPLSTSSDTYPPFDLY